MYNIKCETDLQSRLDARDKCSGLGGGWCTGTTQRDGMGRKVGEGFGMGNTCKSMADSCQCMAKTTTYYKVISLQLIKINGKINK